MAIVRASTEAIGLTQLAESWAINLRAHVHADSSAALAISTRKGCGRLRHVRIGHLWIQEASENGQVKFCKVRGTLNPADLLTKFLPGARIANLCEQLSQVPREGSSQIKLALRLGSATAGQMPTFAVRGGVMAEPPSTTVLPPDVVTSIPS